MRTAQNQDEFPADSRSCANDISISVFVGFLSMARKRKELARRFCCPIISRRLLWRFFSLISVYEFVRAARRAKRSRLKSTYNARFLHSLPPNNLIFYHFFSFSLSDCLHISFASESFHRIRVMKWTEKVLARQARDDEFQSLVCY